jgi:exopolyphosphatase / guanosine-5'-triphosphate,3'-diphosphate pyrophosphatase
VDDRWAVIDLGSNSFRLVVYAARDGAWQRTDEIYEPVRIGEGLQATGELGEQPMARGAAVLEVFAHFCAAAGIPRERIDGVATSAIRDASNQAAFLARAEEAGLPVRVLSTDDEARLGYLAAVNSTSMGDGVVLDLGGGSLQLVKVAGRRAQRLASWKLGAVRMTERFLPDGGPAKRKQLDALRAHVHRKLDKAGWPAGGGGHLVAIGGTVRNLAAAAQRIAEVPEFGVQGFVLERAALDGLVDRLAAVPAAERGRVPGIKPARADLILAGAVVVQAVLDFGDFDGAEVTEAGLREGVFFEHLLGDPPLFEDVRRQSVLNLAARYGAHPERNRHVAHVAHLALGLFDALAALGLHEGDPVERELLWAACALHDIGMTIDYDDHHKHSRYLVLSAGLPGFSQREVALVGQAIRFHRKGLPSLGPFGALARKGDEALLQRIAVLLRLAEDLERPRDQAVRAARPRLDDRTLRLELDLAAGADDRVPRWAATRETELFGRAFGPQLEVA